MHLPAAVGYVTVMSILGRLMGTAENTARTAARGGRGRGMAPRGGMSTGRGYGRATSGRMGRGRPATPAASGLGGLIGGLLRRR
ncbi:hypothetical protein [Geodermatophilus sp. DSM 44513]|uniref:hypothetical protein n=1 Tax=Geodermatophilus sp. DSM 44513 TaxID=1528104 RepID=UPI0012717008|nr:hypothetical protein [Geodermatophilus sp. DSM 44513]WNV76204.1 hypothetical protein RTG05_02750 [Geodermatophilus sp. DSM 44513]